MTKYYRKIPRLYVHLSLCYLLYTIALIPLLFWSRIFILPYILVFILATAVFIENIKKTNNNARTATHSSHGRLGAKFAQRSGIRGARSVDK